jgi:hypothetical protein
MSNFGKDNYCYLIKQSAILTWPVSVTIIALLSLSGCGDFFAQKPTELESMSVLKDLQQVRENPHIENTLPDIYLQPPSRVNIAEGVKLFYFTKHHPAGKLADLVNQQLGLKVVPIPSTNQLVIHCPDNAAADNTLEYLELIDVPPIQVNIDCLILERFGDVTMDWQTSIMIENFLGEGVTFGEQRGTFDNAGVLTDLDPAFPGAALREEARDTFGLQFGYWIDENVPGHQVRAIVDVLESRGYLKILLNPTLETINGKTAKVSIEDYAPYETIETGQGGTSDLFSKTQYEWIADSLEVTPSVFADGFVGLKTAIKVGSRSKPEGVTQKAIITERSIKVAENRIQPGHSLIIGGMRKAEKRSVVRGIPFFKDIPLLGILFSSKDFEEKGTEIIFILTPSISSGGRPYNEVADEIRRKHEEIRYDPELADVLSDPLGASAYTDLVEAQATEAEVARVKAEMEKADAEKRARAAKDAAEKAAAEEAKAEAELKKIQAEVQKALAEAEKAKAATAEAQKLTEAEKAKAAAALAEKQKALEQAQTAAQAAEQARKQAQDALEKAKQQQRKTQQAIEQIEKAKAEAKAAQEADQNQNPAPENTPGTEPQDPEDIIQQWMRKKK